ncbi:hypothetical protein L1283_000375 [Sphingobacterium sp. HSC-15S19]
MAVITGLNKDSLYILGYGVHPFDMGGWHFIRLVP